MVIEFQYDKKIEIVDWLTNNISRENIRWWVSRQNQITLDVTEEEKSMLTFAMLKWAKSPE